jgi:hypothetical protein
MRGWISGSPPVSFTPASPSASAWSSTEMNRSKSSDGYVRPPVWNSGSIQQ